MIELLLIEAGLDRYDVERKKACKQKDLKPQIFDSLKHFDGVQSIYLSDPENIK